MSRQAERLEHRPACGWLERSAASLRAAARGWPLLPTPPRLGRVHGRSLGLDGARGLNSRASKSVVVAAAAPPGSQLRPTRFSASTGHGHTTCVGIQPNQPLQRTGSRAAALRTRWPAAERQLVRPPTKAAAPGESRHLAGVVLLAMSLPLVACASRGRQAPPPDKEALQASVEAAVYSAVLTQAFVRPETRELVVEATPQLPTYMLKGTYHELLPVLERAQANAHALPASISASVPVTLLSEAEVSVAFPTARDWQSFFRAYPESDGLIELSAIGFDPSQQQALVYGWRACGGRCGYGALFLLEQHQGQWVIRERLWEAIA
jgi:hypothetical protein